MQNVMPQLNLTNQALQQAMASQTAGKTGKSSQNDRFRDLLQNSSGKKPVKEQKSESDVLQDRGAKAESAEKAEMKPSADAQENAVGITTENEQEGDGAAAEEMAGNANAGLFLFQFLADSSPITYQAVSESDNFVEYAPEAQQITEMAIPVSQENGVMEAQTVLPDGFSMQMDKAEKVEKPADGAENFTVMKPEAQTVEVPVVAEQEVKRESAPQTRKEIVQKPQLSQRAENVQTTAVRQTEAGVSASRESGQLSKESQGETEEFNNLGYSAENIMQQNPVPNQAQGMTQTQQTVHIRAGNSQELMNQLTQHLRDKVIVENQEFEIQIHPENLGKLAIKVAYAAEKVSISIVCSNEKTMETLSAGAKNIAQIMEENLGTPTTVFVDQQEENYLEQYRNQQDSHQQQQQQEQKKEKENNSEDTQDFLQQLRLGLI